MSDQLTQKERVDYELEADRMTRDLVQAELQLAGARAQLAATHAAIRALPKYWVSISDAPQKGREQFVRWEALARLLGDGPSKIADADRKSTETADQRRIEHLTNALSDCLDVIEPIRDELRKQGKADAATCCDEVIAYSRDALSARLLGDPAQQPRQEPNVKALIDRAQTFMGEAFDREVRGEVTSEAEAVDLIRLLLLCLGDPAQEQP